VDLDAQTIDEFGFDIDPEVKHRLLNGLDDISMTLQQEARISAYEQERERVGPVTTSL
jgi:3-isopropylmalate/(R)-2-methylmalate dehydratase small subunit